MKALFIAGSPRVKGCTSLLVDRVMTGMRGCGISITKHVLGDMRIDYCLGCKTCYATRRCVQRDDMDMLVDELFESDLILIAAPSYWGDVPGHLKVFFDRSAALCDTLEGGTIVPPGKKGFSLALRAGRRQEENQHIIDTVEHYYGHLGIEPCGRITFEKVNEVDDILSDDVVSDRAVEFGRKISEESRVGHA